MKITEIDFTDPEEIKISGILKGGKCPVCNKEFAEIKDMEEHFMGECRKELLTLIKNSIKEME